MDFRSFLATGSNSKVFGGSLSALSDLISEMSVLKKTGVIIGIAGLVLFIRFLTIPSCVKSDWAMFGTNYRFYSISYQNSLDVNKVKKTIIYSGFFSLEKSLDSTASKRLLNTVLDSSSYKQGEWGTPDYSKTLYYEDVNGNIIGKTVFDYIGQTRTWPSTEQQTKCGSLTQSGLNKVLELIN